MMKYEKLEVVWIILQDTVILSIASRQIHATFELITERLLCLPKKQFQSILYSPDLVICIHFSQLLFLTFFFLPLSWLGLFHLKSTLIKYSYIHIHTHFLHCGDVEKRRDCTLIGILIGLAGECRAWLESEHFTYSPTPRGPVYACTLCNWWVGFLVAVVH